MCKKTATMNVQVVSNTPNRVGGEYFCDAITGNNRQRKENNTGSKCILSINN
jgi:hypothetical protein